MLVGQQFGPFTIDKELGSGAMGTVYRGRYTKTGQVMAIKVMAPGIGSTNASAMDRFEREITVLKQLNHPNIVRLFGAGKTQGARYFAMEHIEGESLDRVMSRRGRMTWEEVVVLGQQLCLALQHAHDKGIIHRDLKPSNIMILSDGTLKLTDFGIAKVSDLEALTATNCTVGTAAYMSPEQCKGQSDLTPKSDLYSMGVLFYELLTGKKPFAADNAMEMFLQHVQGTFERPSRRVLDIPVWLDTLVCQLLEKKPDQRPLDAHMVANTLSSIHEKVEAQQSAGVEAVRRRLIDRAPGQKRPDEEDKEAARILMTGKGRSRRKKKKFYQRVWVQATGLLLALGVVGSLLALVFRPPSADNLYQQAKKLMDSPNFEDHEKALDGPIKEYLRRYGNREDQQAKTVQEWNDGVAIQQKERLLYNYLQKEHSKAVFKFQADSKTEKEAFDAAKAEDDGDRKEAINHWKTIEQSGSRTWEMVAKKHLGELMALEKIDGDCEEIHKRIYNSGEEQKLPDRRLQQAFLAWRAGKFGDHRQARALFKALQEEAFKEPDGLRPLYLYAAWKIKESPNKGQSEEDVKKMVKDRLKDMREGLAKKEIRKNDVRRDCLDIIALYEEDQDNDLKECAQQAHKLLDQIQK
jgi:serine/threonine-protein kinase